MKLGTQSCSIILHDIVPTFHDGWRVSVCLCLKLIIKRKPNMYIQSNIVWSYWINDDMKLGTQILFHYSALYSSYFP